MQLQTIISSGRSIVIYRQVAKNRQERKEILEQKAGAGAEATR
jgi:hypothetical protein